MDPDLPLVATGAGLSGCIARWFVDAWPGPARFVGPAYFLEPRPADGVQLLVASQGSSPHARLAIRAGNEYARCTVCGAVDPRGLCPEARWIQTPSHREEGLRVEGPLAQIQALQALLPQTPTPIPPVGLPPDGPPIALLHDGAPQARLFAELTAWTLLEHLGPQAARAYELLDFAHGGLQALPTAGSGRLWTFGAVPPRVEALVAEAVAPHGLVSVGVGPDAWRTIVRAVASWPRRPPFSRDGGLYAIETRSVPVV